MARSYFQKGNLIIQLLAENSRKFPPEKCEFSREDAEIFYDIAEEIFSSLLTNDDVSISAYDVYDMWGYLLLEKAPLARNAMQSLDFYELAQEKFLLALSAKVCVCVWWCTCVYVFYTLQTY